jgi:hypothetical protein
MLYMEIKLGFSLEQMNRLTVIGTGGRSDEASVEKRRILNNQ